VLTLTNQNEILAFFTSLEQPLAAKHLQLAQDLTNMKPLNIFCVNFDQSERTIGVFHEPRTASCCKTSASGPRSDRLEAFKYFLLTVTNQNEPLAFFKILD